MRRTQQFFLWIHISRARARRVLPTIPPVTAADAAIGKLIRALQQRKIYGNTAVIVVADHGESLGAHGEDAHGIFLYDETIHVPLLIKLAEGRPAAKPATTASSSQSQARGYRSYPA